MEALAEANAAEPKTFLADTGYWSADALNALEAKADLFVAPRGKEQVNRRRQHVLDALCAGQIDLDEAAQRLEVTQARVRQLHKEATTPGSTLLWQKRMRARLDTEGGRALYRRRRVTVEPVFGNIKANIGFRRFSRRGIDAVRSEWRLICTAHNLLKLRQRRLAL